MKGLFETHIDLTAKVLDLRLERQNLVAGNLANVDTPGYRARRIEFENELQSALALDQRGKVTRTNSKHMPSAFTVDGFEGKGIKEFEPRQIFGEDRVDLDKEMAVMGKNAMLYNALTEVITKNFSGLQRVIQEGAK
ncbi:flagellar basal body rod protein FlgB [Paucidesulfovibrio longus]|jgi:flagellar basal-body rod protein FlgB|uniref:flagellar basal body rod protein FlgB n=1 Tax=Paucidesulfovibrio longus TaxID=889 RepID=UPI0003B6613B|nr:flagellar basal body rod protein FlgB [Paucidesulfovibrio longus]